MRKVRKIIAVLLAALLAVSLYACSSPTSADTSASPSAAASPSASTTAVTNSEALAFDSSAWNYDADNDVYWQIGVGYCADPQATDYESMGIYVPGAYMDATDNGDGTYTCTVNTTGTVNGYTSDSAPVVMPVNTAGYSAQPAPTAYSYDSISQYIEAGFIYVNAGCRGRDNGTNSDGTTYVGDAPWGVTDLKAAVRYLRYNTESLPGDTDSIFTFGHSGGGAQSAVMGATGDSELYYPYLEAIGAVMYDDEGNYISDAISGAMCWCPITTLDAADAAYEWMMGQYSTSGTRADTTWTSALSDDLAAAFADYINSLGLTDENGNVLTLTASDEGIYTSGTYYDYVLAAIEQSLNNFLSDTSFPYASGGQSGIPSGEMPSGAMPSGEMPSGGMPSGSTGSTESVTYETAQDYIDSLNSDVTWISYDAATNTASITSIEAFVTHCKNASKNVAAFDDLDLSQAENLVFGNGDSDALHFDTVLAGLLAANQDEYASYSDWDTAYIEAYATDLTSVDSLGTDSVTRQNMYNPMYYVSSASAGYGTSTPATYWRINSGINQGDTSLTTELNLALALGTCEGVEDVDFSTVWDQGHTAAERTGDSTSNFIAWVIECCG